MPQVSADTRVTAVSCCSNGAQRGWPRHRNAGRGIDGGFESAAREALAQFAVQRRDCIERVPCRRRVRAVRLQTASRFRSPPADRYSTVPPPGAIVTAIFRCIVVPLSPASDSSPKQLRRAYWAWIAVCVSWGTTFLATRVAIESIPPFAMAGPRHFIAGVVLALILRMRGIKLPPLSSWGGHALLGLLMIGFGNGCLVWAQQFMPERCGRGAGVGDSVLDDWRRSVHAERRARSASARCSACCSASAASSC